MTLQAAKKKLEKAGYNAELIKWCKDDQIVTRLRVDTDYTGYYPTFETLAAHDEIRKMFAKSDLHIESHPAKVCIYIG